MGTARLVADRTVHRAFEAELQQGAGILKVAKKLGVGHSTVPRMKASLG